MDLHIDLQINYFFFLTVTPSAPCGCWHQSRRTPALELFAAPSLLPPLPYFLPVATLAPRSGGFGWRLGLPEVLAASHCPS
jgi:hypothetical protein